MFIDTHAHLDMPAFEQDLPNVLQRAQEAGVRLIMTIGSDLPSCYKAVQLAQAHDFIYAAVGIHPHDAKSVTSDTYKALAELARKPKVVAVGEIGLDYYYEHSPKETQIAVFERQLELANKLNLPVVIHSRDAADDVLNILRKKRVNKKGVLHCFSGDEKFLQECLDLGFYISLAGVVTFPKALALQQLVKLIPSERLLLETDCPYLAPVPWRGKRNEPAYMLATAQKVAELKGLNVEDVARISSLNAHQLFGINGVDVKSKIAYPIRDSLYLNITNRCTNQCGFCARQQSYFVQGHNLHLDSEPTVEEVLAALPDLTHYRELVFCGLGEPLLRLDVIKAVSAYVKKRGVKVRVNTNGQGNLIYGRNIVPELAGLVDVFSISLNAPNAALYQKLCSSQYGEAAYPAILEFVSAGLSAGIEVVLTALDMPGIDMDACAQIARQLGATLRVRHYNEVG